ncbi:hypothetical protein BTHI11S_04891 [Bosea thiooxidans]
MDDRLAAGHELVAPAFAIYSKKLSTAQGAGSGRASDKSVKATAWLNQNSAGTAAYGEVPFRGSEIRR